MEPTERSDVLASKLLIGNGRQKTTAGCKNHIGVVLGFFAIFHA